MHQLLDGGHVDPLEAWHLYLRKAENDRGRGRQRTSPGEWSTTFERRMAACRIRWDEELGEYIQGGMPLFRNVERQNRRYLAPLLDAAHRISEERLIVYASSSHAPS
jgi:hypothetical protein